MFFEKNALKLNPAQTHADTDKDRLDSPTRETRKGMKKTCPMRKESPIIP